MARSGRKCGIKPWEGLVRRLDPGKGKPFWANMRPGAGMWVEDAGPGENVGKVPTSRLQQPQCALVQRRGLAVLAITEVLVAGSAELFHRVRDFRGHPQEGP